MNRIFPFLNWLPLAKKHWKDDLIAGITGTIIVIPQAVAFAMIAGMPPEYGFYMAMISPIIAALWGSSHHLISGPTTTSSIVIFSIVSKFYHPDTDIEAYISMTILLSFMTGIIKLMMGLFRMGKIVDFVSNSVVIGFTTGAGILIAFKQLKHVFGMKIPQGSTLVNIVQYITSNINNTNIYALLVALTTLISAILIKKYIKKIGRFNMLFAMIIGTFLSIKLGGKAVGIETIGEIKNNLPPFKIPNFNLVQMRDLFGGAVVLALMGLVEAVSISRSIGLHSHQKLNNNQEFIGQGLSNIIPSFFSCYASSGSFTRSGVNFQAGGKTPFSAVIAAVGLMLVIKFGGEYASYLPRPAMGGILLLVGYNLIDKKHVKLIYNSSKKELIVFAVTMLSTLFLHLEQAVLLGIAASLLFYLEKTSKPNIAILGINENKELVNRIRDKNIIECSNLKIIRVDGSLYFASVEIISDYLNKIYSDNKVQSLLIVSSGINMIDLGAAELLAHEAKNWKQNRSGLYFCEMKAISQDVLKKGGFYNIIGADHFFVDKKTAIAEIHKQYEKSCKVKAFDECYK